MKKMVDYPYYPPKKPIPDKLTREEVGFFKLHVKQGSQNEEGIMPASTAAKVRKGVLIFLGIAIAVSIIIFGIQMSR